MVHVRGRTLARRPFLSLLVLASLLAGFALFQSTPTLAAPIGTISGYVRQGGASGPGVPNARIYLAIASSPFGQRATTDANGYYQFTYDTQGHQESLRVSSDPGSTPNPWYGQTYGYGESFQVNFVAAASITPTPTNTPTAVPCSAPPWSPTAIYTNGGTVSHKGRIWRAKWWTQGEEPGSSAAWEDLGPCGTPTPTPSPTPTGSPTPTATRFPCPTRTPVPLLVDPATSPTNLLSQQIKVYTTDAQTITVQSEAGLTTYTGPTPWPTLITVNLLANTEHHLTVKAHIRRTVDSNGCVNGGYTLQTSRDRNGALLTIVQMTGTPTFTPTPTVCPMPAPIPLSVEPVTSPTNLLSQAIRIQTTGAQTVTVQSEAGVAIWSRPAPWTGQITINLLPNFVHHLTVRASVPTTTGPNGCVFPGYTITATRDRNGAPLTILQTGQPTVTVTPTCPPVAPIPLSVEPVTSPTSQLTQTIRIQTTGAQTVTVQSEAGIATWSKPAPWTGQIAVNLLPNTTHHLTVRAYAVISGYPSCGYSVSVSYDRYGAPLTIIQGSATPTATPTPAIQPWDGNFHAYAAGDRVTYNGRVYTCVQAHTSQPGWTPEAVPALWSAN